MIDLTVKTLDSQNHTFSLNDDITVRQFKEHIADSVNIAVDLQRLIYCGRVLQDEKLLSEYDVNGKVIHLVQRAPPSSTQRSHNTSQNQGQSHGGTGEWQSAPRVVYRHTQFHDDPMYIGSFSIPTDVLEGYEWPAPQLNNTLLNNHLTVVRRMLDQANSAIDRLDNPSAAAASSSTSAESNSSSTPPNRTQPAAASATESRPPWEQMVDFPIPTTETTDSDDVESSPQQPSPPPPAQEQSEQKQQQQPDDTTPEHSASASNQASSSESNDTASSNDAMVPRELVELLDMLLTTQDRLQPYIRNRLLSNGAAAYRQLNHEENQRIMDGVSECFHFLSHAQHALSNLHINMQQSPPRTIRCRPMVLQPSAILQAGLPIQVEAHISLHGQVENNGDGDDNATTNTSRTSTASNQTTTTSAGNETPSATATNSQTQSPPQQVTPDPSRQTPRQQQSQTSFGTVFNFPNNVEVVMESAPQASRVWSFSASGESPGSGNNNNNNIVTNNNNGNTTSGPTAGVPGGVGFPFGGVPSTDMIRNLMQAVAGYMVQSGVTHTPPPTTTSPASNVSSNTTPISCPRHPPRAASSESTANSGQNSQTRGNTETHPTTSTQTRTTSRTHVFHQHAQALGVGVGLASSLDFDPLLPCNSHHLRRGNTSSSSSSASASASASTGTTNIAASTQTGGQNNVSSTHASTQGRTTVTSTHPRVATIRGVQIVDGPFVNLSLAESIANFERISSASQGGIPFMRVLSNQIAAASTDGCPRTPEFIRLLFNAFGSLPVHWWCRLVRGNLTPLSDVLIRRITTRIIAHTGETSVARLPFVISELLCNELRSILERTFDGEICADENGPIDIYATVNKMLGNFVIELARAAYSHEIVLTNIVQLIQDFGRNLSAVLVYSLRGGQSGLERVIARLASDMSRGTQERFREWILGTVVNWFCDYTRQLEPIDGSKILDYIVYKNMTQVATTSSETAHSRPESVSEPMEVDIEPNSRPPTHNSWMFDDEMPTATFPGHENLLPDWIPIVARDGVTQRRQLSLSDDEVTTMSDAYLATMPSKRRKLVEQRKAPLLVSPTSNRSAIPSSMERLIRESVGRAGFEEVDGAVAAIVADPTVRRAFGQAIRESLNPRRYQTPDFPDELRFPNATKFFTNPNRPTKQ